MPLQSRNVNGDHQTNMNPNYPSEKACPDTNFKTRKYIFRLGAVRSQQNLVIISFGDNGGVEVDVLTLAT